MTDPQVIVNLGTGGSDLNGQNGSTSSADSNDALFLDWPGDNGGNYVYLPRVAPSRLSVPDAADLQIGGDITLIACVDLDSWALGSTQILVAKFASGTGTQNYRFAVGTTGLLQFTYRSVSTSTTRFINSTAAVPVTSGPLWVAVAVDSDGSSPNSLIRFYTASFVNTDVPTAWTQLGADVGTAVVHDPPTDTTAVSIGADNDGSTGMDGKVYRALIADDIGAGVTPGTNYVLDVDTSVISSGSATSFTALTGQTVTINRSTSGRKSVAVVSPVWLFGTDDYMEVADNALIDFDANDDFTVLAVVRQWATPANFGAYLNKRDANDGSKGYGMGSAGTNVKLFAAIDDGPNIATRQNPSFTAGGLAVLSATINRTAQTLETGVNGGGFGTVSIASVGSLANADPLRIGRVSSGGPAYQDFELLGVAVFRRALTQAEITSLTTYYQNKAA